MTASIERSNVWPAVIATGLILSAALGWMVYGRVSLLKTGQELRVEVIPVDPRDFFRGDYVVLGYPFTTTADLLMPGGTRQGDSVYSTIKPDGGSKWSLVQVTASYPEKIEPGHRVLKGVARYVSWRAKKSEPAPGQIAYGIESYFVPEGTGGSIETQIRDKKIEVVLAVAATGETAIKALLIDGKRVHEEPIL
jgi:uncharacterized membrane-anchored protein